eukprot:gene15459-18342_t
MVYQYSILLFHEFQCLDLVKTFTVPSPIWSLSEVTTTNGTICYGSECDIQILVSLVLAELIGACGLVSKVQCFNELGITGMRPDIWVVLSHGAPIGVVEVKKPGSKILDNLHTHGQILDYMLRLEHLYGQVNVFGIVTTYKDWRVCWLQGESDTTAQAKSISNSFEPHSIESPSAEPTLPTKVLSRSLYGSGVISYTDNTLPRVIMSTILKMYYSPRRHVPLLSEQGSRIDYRGGAHGRVWMCCTTSGNVFILKFAQPASEQTNKSEEEKNEENTSGKKMLTNEAAVWKSIYKLPALVKQWSSSWALMIPFVISASETDWLDEGFKAKVKETIILFARSGYLHNDLHHRHVAKYTKG